MNNLVIPEEWREVLLKVREVFPNAIIAGGALRDLEYNRPVKDVDIFIPVVRPEGSREQQEAFIIEQMQKLDMLFDEQITLPVLACPSDAPLYFKDMKDDLLKTGRWVENVQRTVIGETTFEFIFCAPETCDVEMFDFSICQIWYDGEDVCRTRAYKKTLAGGPIVYNRDYRNPRRAEDRIRRMREKFPDKLVIV